MAKPTSRIGRVLMTGPLAPFAGAYRLALAQRGYTPLTAVNESRQVGRLSRWLEASGLAACELSGERIEEFLAFQRASGRVRATWPVRACCACWMCCASWEWFQHPGLRGRARQRRCCWPALSTTCSPSAPWRLARPADT